MANAILPDFSKPVPMLQFALFVNGEFMFCLWCIFFTYFYIRTFSISHIFKTEKQRNILENVVTGLMFELSLFIQYCS